MVMQTVVIRRIDVSDVEALAAFALRNQSFHGDDLVMPIDPAGWATLTADPGGRWYRVDHQVSDAGGPLGVMCLVRWSGLPWCSAELGAGADERAAGRGEMAAGLRRLLEIEMLAGPLERVEALIRPGHTASERFVAAAGMRSEGMARQILTRLGKRIDMVRWAVVRSDLSSPSQSQLRNAVIVSESTAGLDCESTT